MQAYEFDPQDLPVAITFPNGDGSFTQEKEPVYQLSEQVYLGDALYEEGEVIATRAIPNHSMVPMNRAAGERYKAWIESLPIKGGESLTMEDFTEAAHLLRNDPDLEKLKPEDIARATAKMAITIRNKRSGTALALPDMQGDIFRTQKSRVPAMANVRITDANLRGPGQTEKNVLHQPKRAAAPVARMKPPASAPAA